MWYGGKVGMEEGRVWYVGQVGMEEGRVWYGGWRRDVCGMGGR